ncbi:WD40/YVTN/BNR-like repeat-containing protein [Metapseudomonas otitidis]|uniref:WD40/YVTN/BNR-like repeat-containing protein n=1 Tax=Metapseudomonas otitidis TaxID=319939 RepID=UPI001F1FE5F3|nr:hypothetical protein [Pseudomonas otitidis]
MNSGSITFAKCSIVRRDLVFISAQVTELNNRNVNHTKVLRWKAGAFAHFMIDSATTVISVTTPPLTVFSMGLDGDIHLFRGSTRTTEHIVGPNDSGLLCDMRLIAGSHYVAGMQRQVYRRHEDGGWHSIADSIRNREGIKGFHSIDGFSATELYAVGMDGEIWLFDGRHWQALGSPTSMTLQSVHCSDDGNVYIVGQAGVVLVGRGDQWVPVNLNDFSEDLWGVTVFNGDLFIASSKAVYRIADGQLKKANIGSDGAGSASFLASGDGVLWSVGSRHLAFTADGDSWTVVDYDDASY